MRLDRRTLSRATFPALRRLAAFVGLRNVSHAHHAALVEVLVRRLDRLP